jgi:hypothetical protein
VASNGRAVSVRLTAYCGVEFRCERHLAGSLDFLGRSHVGPNMTNAVRQREPRFGGQNSFL